MKRTQLLLLLTLLCLLLPARAQDRLTTRMEQLRGRYDIHFIYDASLHGLLEATAPSRTFDASLTLEDALHRTFDGTAVAWQRRGRNVVLKAARPAPAAPRTRRVTLSGHITDAASGETLIGAGVLSGTTGAVTNEFGFYSLTLPAGKHLFLTAYIGYDPVRLELDLQRDTTLNFTLHAHASLDAARIVSRKDAGLQSVHPGSFEMPVSLIQRTPALLGEADVIKALQLLPGVQGGQEGFAGLHVRGGGPEENLILLDGVPVYNMDHILGLFSIFQPEAVKNVTLFKGAFPARYGGRISSILDIRTNDGNMRQTKGSLTVGLLNDKFHLEGPILRDRLSYSVSVRGLHSILAEPLLRILLKNDYYNYYFYDLNGKLTWRAGDRDRLYLSLYRGTDNGGFFTDYQSKTDLVSIHDTKTSRLGATLNWGSTVGALRWNHIFSPRIFANATLSVNRYRTVIDFSRATKGERIGESYDNDLRASYRSGILDIGARMDFDWTPAPDHLVKFGAEYIRHAFRPETLSSVTRAGEEQTVRNLLLGSDYIGDDASLYAEDNISIGNHLSLNPGLRLSCFSTQGRNYFSLQPRVSAKFAMDGGLSFKAGYSRMAQYVHLLSSTTIALPLDLWVPITKDIKPVVSDQYSLGAYYNGLPGWEFSLEAYWKEMDNLLEYKDGVILLANSEGWEKQVETGRGRARGIELFASKTTGKTTGSLSYTLAWSDRWFPDGSINAGRPFPYKYDRRHNLSLTLDHRFSEKVDLSASWVFMSGGTLTLPLRETAILFPDAAGMPVQQAPYVAARNNYRLPPTHRLNIGVNLRHTTRKGNEAVWNISLYNAYNAMNPNFILYRNDFIWGKDPASEDSLALFKLTVLPILPAFSYTYHF